MKKFPILTVVYLLLSFSVFSQNASPTSYNIEGNIRGLNGRSISIIVPRLGEGYTSDTLIAKSEGDKFNLKGNTKGSRRAELYIGEIKQRNLASFFLEPGNIAISGSTDQLDNLSIKGTKANNDLTETQRYLAPIYARRSQLYAKLRSLVDSPAEAAKIQKQIQGKTDSVNSYKVHFMETRPDSEISHGFLYVLQDAMPTSTAERIFNNFSAEWKKTSEGERISSKLQATKSVAVGKVAPDFASKDTSGLSIKLSDFKGKYVLLEFWAHWCVPCRAQHPHMKELYEKFKDKDFTILQYSVDVKKDEKKWKEAIKQDGLVWPQAGDLQNGQAPVAKLYGVQPIPDSFFISPDGIILGRRLSVKQIEEILSKSKI